MARLYQRALLPFSVGGTNGIGEATLRQFAIHTRQPRAYIIGRCQEAGDRISSECKEIKPEGEFTFIKAGVSLNRNVDDVCRTIKSREKAINLLFLSTGSLVFDKETEEGLNVAASLTLYSRTRFAVNLLPLLRNASVLRRVVSVFVGTKEGAVDIKNIQARGMSMMPARAHNASLTTLSLEMLAEQAPNVSFIHAFPGVVNTGIWRGTTGLFALDMKVVLTLAGPSIYISNEESGERHFYLAMSEQCPARNSTRETRSETSETPARGTNAEIGSGVCSVDNKGESAAPEVEKVLTDLRRDGVKEELWANVQGESQRIVGSATA